MKTADRAAVRVLRSLLEREQLTIKQGPYVWGLYRDGVQVKAGAVMNGEDPTEAIHAAAKAVIRQPSKPIPA
jgi:hypothetical protein